MCVEATTAILIASAVSAGSSLIQGQQQARIARTNQQLMQGEIALQNAQLEEESRIAKLNAKEQENQRKQALRRSVATQRALNRGLENNSFLALVQYEEEALAKDIANLRLGSTVETSRLASAISVNNVRASQPSGASSYSTAGVLGAASSLSSGYADYALTRSGSTKQTDVNKVYSASSPNYGYATRNYD
tara:strand:- start:591 stop:1163 length:573 start_codon:yes stop_codon:yes gene_type:complete